MPEADAPRPSEPNRRSPERPAGAPPSWRIDPGSDGRGAPKEEPQSRFNLPRPGWRFLLVVLALFALNAFLASKVPDRDARIRIPYNPTFLNQLEAGNVREMVSTGDAIRATSRPRSRFRPSGQDGSRSSTRFETQLPAFVSGERLEGLVESKGVVLNAKPPEEGRSWLITAPLASGRRSCSSRSSSSCCGVPPAAAAARRLMAFGRSRAKRYEGAQASA